MSLADHLVKGSLMPTHREAALLIRHFRGGGVCPVCDSPITWVPEETIWVCGCTELRDNNK